METMYTVVTINGRGFMFQADRMMEFKGEYVFYDGDEIVGEFNKNSIAGYFISRYVEEEDD